jgi:dCTP diphosphatase
MDVELLKARLRRFAAEREWEPYHDPKNLSMALAAEAGELLEVFQWKTSDEVREGLADAELEGAAEELADVLIYLIRLSDVLDIDLDQALERKIALNEQRYPVELAKGNATKHDKRIR